DIVAFEDELTARPDLDSASADLLLRAKQMGFSDRQLAHVWHTYEREVRSARLDKGVTAVFKLVDTCAAEFEAVTPYYYSTYEARVTRFKDEGRRMNKDDSSFILHPSSLSEDETKPPSGKKRIVILGGGPNRIGQGIEFDYCCV